MNEQVEYEHPIDGELPAEDETHEPTDEEAAEHEEAEAEPEAEPEETSGAVDQKVIDRFFAQLDNEAARHAKRIGDIMGEEAQSLNLCPTCGPIDGMPNLVGFVLDAPLHAEAVARMRAALGLNDETNVKPDPYSRPCASCDGWGVVQTGSHVPNLEVRRCDDCNGQGFVLLNAPQKHAPLATVNGGEPAPSTYVPQPLGPEPPEVAALRARGWGVIPPLPGITTQDALSGGVT